MENYTPEELQEALRAIASLISKCEKVKLKLKEKSPQHTLIVNRLKAFRISQQLINKELGL